MSARRCQIYDDMATVRSTISSGAFNTDDQLERGYQVWLQFGRPADTCISVENGPKGNEVYRRTTRRVGC